MIQLLAHLVGDYVLQSHVMATRKTSSWLWAFIHAAFYTLPFLALTQDWWRLAVIGGTHAAIDRLAIARRWCQWYGVGFPGLWHRTWCMAGHRMGAEPICPEDYCCAPPQAAFVPPPPFLGVWLTIIVDNTFHLVINYMALR